MGYALDGLIINRCLPESAAKFRDLAQGTEREILRTRTSGEATVIEDILGSVKSHPRNMDLWTVRIEEKIDDLCNVNAVVSLAEELVGG
jgi:hypothetical protein